MQILVASRVGCAYLQVIVKTLRKPALRGSAPHGSSALVCFVAFSCCATVQAQQTGLPTDPTEPLRKFPITFLVRRPEFGAEWISILRVPSLRPKDDVRAVVDDRLQGNWTLTEAIVQAGERVQVKSWNLWDKRWREKPIEIGTLPDADAVPLFFLTLNRHQERHVYDAVRHALETSSQLILSQTATFETIYRQQNRLLNFMTAYASLGPKVAPDPVSLKDRADQINLDLGATYDPNAQTTSPGQLQHSLDATVGLLGAYRESPDNPVPAAAVTQSQLPAVVSDWVGLVGDLMKVFIRPPKDIKLTFIPASAMEGEPGVSMEEQSMALITQRVMETKDDSLPSIVYRPEFDRKAVSRPLPVGFARTQVLAENREVSIPMGAESRELFLHPWSWSWQVSDDGKQFNPLVGAHLVPGRGLVFPISSEWWGADTDRKLYVQARVGFQPAQTVAVQIAKIRPQMWTLPNGGALDIASGDPSVAIRLNRNGSDQPFYQFSGVTLRDSAGRLFPASEVKYAGSMEAVFNLNGAAPGTAEIRVQQEGQVGQDPPVKLFIAPKHPSISISCGKGDRVLKISGPEASWVKSVQAAPLAVEGTDDSEAGSRRLTLSGALPATTKSLAVTYRDPARGLEWTVSEPVSVGLPRPRAAATVVGSIPSTIPVGAGTDGSWAMATLPPGWFKSKQPVRVQLAASTPFSWTHDVSLGLGFGSSGDVQKVVDIPEGSMFAMDESSANAYLTVDLDSELARDARRNTGLIWLRLSRSDLASPWTLINVQTESGSAPLRAVKVPTIINVEPTATGTKITMSGCDQVLGIRFPGQAGVVAPVFLDSALGGLNATVEGPKDAAEFDIELRDASEGAIHIKIVRKP